MVVSLLLSKESSLKLYTLGKTKEFLLEESGAKLPAEFEHSTCDFVLRGKTCFVSVASFLELHEKLCFAVFFIVLSLMNTLQGLNTKTIFHSDQVVLRNWKEESANISVELWKPLNLSTENFLSHLL